MRGYPKVSVIVVTHNRREDLGEAIESLCQQTYSNIEIIVVDNGSSDGTCSMVREKFAGAKLIELRKNTGPYEGRNIGVATSEGDILFFLDDDATLETGSIAGIVDRFSMEKDLGVIVCKLIEANTGVLDPRLYYNVTSHFDGEFYLGDMVAEGATAIRRQVLEEVELWPAHYFRAGIGREISYRIIDSGYNMIYFPGAIVYHKESHLGEHSREQIEREKIFYRTRNLLWITWKYMPLPRALVESLIKVTYCFFESIQNGAFPFFVKGLVAAISGMPRLLKMERSPVSAETLAKIDYLGHGNIVTDLEALGRIAPTGLRSVMLNRFKFLVSNTRRMFAYPARTPGDDRKS